jgi:hypothetical protein
LTDELRERRGLQERARDHLVRLRREGVHDVATDDLRRLRAEARRKLWALRHDCRPNACPLYIVGLQRSGTNMLLGAFSEAPEAGIHNESESSRAFRNWALRDDDVVRSVITQSRHRLVVFKPLVDSHRVVHLMEGLGTPTPGRAIWIYRDVRDRIKSSWAKFGDATGTVVPRIAAGHRGWETGGLSDERLELVHRLGGGDVSRGSAAALFWYLRNGLFFDLGLDRRTDVVLVSYDRFVADPEAFMRQLCEFAGVPYRPDMVRGIERRPSPTPDELDVDPEIASLCKDLRRRLDDAALAT